MLARGHGYCKPCWREINLLFSVPWRRRMKVILGIRCRCASGTNYVVKPISIILLMSLVAPCFAEGVVLENRAIRIEIDPQTFSLRYVGRPGGPNFLDPVYLTERQRNEGGWIAPGGFISDVLPVSARDPAMRRGPATVIEQRSDYVLLMGPLSLRNQLQVKKEYILPRDGDVLTYKLSILSPMKTPHDVSVRITAQLRWSGQISFPKPVHGPPRLVHGRYPEWNGIMGQADKFYAIPLAERSGRDRAVLRSRINQVSITDGNVIWTRSASVTSAGEAESRAVDFFALIDDQSNICQIAFEARQSGVNVGAPLVYVETWTLRDVDVNIARRMPPSGSDEASP